MRRRELTARFLEASAVPDAVERRRRLLLFEDEATTEEEAEMSGIEIISIGAIEPSEGTVALALGGMRVGGSPGGIAARIETTTDPGSSGPALKGGKTIGLGVSRLDGEGEWIIDSLWIGGLPVYANGVGARYCALKALTDEEIVAALDAAADELLAAGVK